MAHTFVSDVRMMSVYSNTGSRYVVTFVDRKSRLVRVYFVKKKSEVVDKAKHFIKWVHTQRGVYPKNLETDGGGEYITRSLQEFLEELGINFEKTEAYTPSQNGIAERINRTLVEGAYSLLRQAGMPSGFWEEAMLHFTYIKNLTPHSKLAGGRPIDVWNEGLEEVDREDLWELPPFGCKADVWVPPARRIGGKDGLHTRVCVYLGKAVNSKAAAFWDFDRDKIIYGHAEKLHTTDFPLKAGHTAQKQGILKKSVRFADTQISHHKESAGSESPSSSSEEGASGSNSSESSDYSVSEYSSVDDVDVEAAGSDRESDPVSSEESEPDHPNSPTQPGRQLRARAAVDYTKGNNTQKTMRNRDGTAVTYDARRMSIAKRAQSGDRVDALLTSVVNQNMKEKQKITRKSMLKRPDKNLFIEGEELEIENGFATGCIERVEEVPEGADMYHVMWVYKVKPETELEPQRYRSRMCVLGNKQKPDSYSETFAAVGKVKMFRLLLTLCVHYGLKMTQLDVSNAFMYADLDREVYIHPPPGYKHLGPLKLNKSLYGLKQAPRLWYDTMKVALEELGYEQLHTDVCCFAHPTERCYVLMYVDDICIATANSTLRKQLLKHLEAKFKLKHFEEAKMYVGLQMKWSRNGDKVKVYQQGYIEKVLELFNMTDCKTQSAPSDSGVKLSRMDERTQERPYRELVGSLLYMLGSRPDVASAVRVCSQYVQWGADAHWRAAKNILRYLKGTKKHGVVYSYEKDYYLTAYCDSDYAQEKDRQSISGYVIYAQGGPVVWKSKKQPTVALSTCEAEYVSLSETIKELLWMSMALRELGVQQDRPMVVHIDNQAAKRLAENSVNHERSKHIDTRYHFIRQVIQSGKVQLHYIDTKKNVSDLLTKATTVAIFKRLVGELVSD